MVFYADFYFILNFILNLFLLILTAMFRQKRCRPAKLAALAAGNALLSVWFIWLCRGREILRLAAAALQVAEMTALAFPLEGIREWRKNASVFLLLSLFSGGSITVLQGVLSRLQIAREHTFWSVTGAAAVIFILLLVFRRELIRQGQSRKNRLQAVILQGDRRAAAAVLYDTGNQLVSPYTGESVAVISTELAEKLALETSQRPILIPYHSIGGDGLLKAYRLQYMKLDNGVVKKDFLAAVSDSLCRQKEIQMILNITWSK